MVTYSSSLFNIHEVISAQWVALRKNSAEVVGKNTWSSVEMPAGWISLSMTQNAGIAKVVLSWYVAAIFTNYEEHFLV